MTWNYGDDWDHGGAAEVAGQPLTACPFKPGTEEHSNWAYCWTRARRDRLKASGQMHDDTMAMKDQVAADMAHLPENRPDPVAALLGPEYQLAPTRSFEGDFLRGAMERMAGQMRDVFAKHIATFTEVAEQMSKLTALMHADPPPSPFTEHLTAVAWTPLTIKDTSS